MRCDRIRMAKDAASARHKDENGFLHVMDNPISREQVAGYYGNEIVGWQKLGLDPANPWIDSTYCFEKK